MTNASVDRMELRELFSAYVGKTIICNMAKHGKKKRVREGCRQAAHEESGLVARIM